MSDPERDETFRRWVDEHRALVHRTARAFATPSDVDDLTQELLLALWKAAPAFRGESRESTFVYRVVHNAALSWRRGRRRRPVESLAEPDAIADEGGGRSRRDDERLLDLVYRRIQALEPIDRSLMLMSLDDLSYEEIGAVLGLKANAVGVRLHRLRKRLLKDLQENLDDL